MSLWLDFPYLAAYGAFFSLAVMAMRDAARRRGWDGFALAKFATLLIAQLYLLTGLAAERARRPPRDPGPRVDAPPAR